MKTRKWWVWWLLWQEHSDDASYTPLPCSQTAMGPRSAVMSSFTSTPITPTTWILQFFSSSNFINFEYVHLALDPGHPEVRKGCDDITKWRKPSNFETVKPKKKGFHSLLPVVLFVIFTLLSPHISRHWKELYRFYYASNSFEQSLWSYRYFWVIEFVSTKDTENINLAPEEQDFHSPVSSFEGNSFIAKFNLVCSVHYLQ